MKRFLLLCMSCFLLVSFSACGKTEKMNDESTVAGIEENTGNEEAPAENTEANANVPLDMEDFYNWEITDEAGENLEFLGGRDKIYRYTALPEECKEIGAAVIKYKEDLSCEKISSTEKISVVN